MNNALSTVYSSKNGPPSVGLENQPWIQFVLLFKNYVGQSTYSRLHETKPELLSEENYQALIATEGQDEADAVKEKKKKKLKKWSKANEKLLKALVLGCHTGGNEQCQIESMENHSTALKLFQGLEKILNERSLAQKNFILGSLNRLTIRDKETRTEFISRLLKLRLLLAGMGVQIDEETTMKERLLNGLKDNKIYAQDARQLEIMNQTFSECVSILKGFDQDESRCEESTLKNPGGHRAQENANLAAGTPNLICHNCGRKGHKAHNCRSGTARGAKGRGNGRGNGKGGRGRGVGGRSGGKGKGNSSAGRGGGGKGKAKDLNCFLCDTPGHRASTCPHKQEFKELIKKRKPDNNLEEDENGWTLHFKLNLFRERDAGQILITKDGNTVKAQ